MIVGAHKGFLEYEKKKEVDKLALMIEVVAIGDPLLSQNATTTAPFFANIDGEKSLFLPNDILDLILHKCLEHS